MVAYVASDREDEYDTERLVDIANHPGFRLVVQHTDLADGRRLRRHLWS